MAKITNQMVENAYEIGKQIYNNQISRLEGIEILENLGMKESSAHDYIYFYSNLIQGKLFTRTTNVYATELYLEKIYHEKGVGMLKNALLSLSQHFDYYEDLTKRAIKNRREVYNKYYDLIKDYSDEIIYADEVESGIEYSEGKTKQVLINSYERNPIARKKCIEFYGVKCQVCEFNFEDKFGDLGKDFIHVHHIVDISMIGKEYSVDPIKDLIPVCPNCHSMLHKRKPAYAIEELKKIMK